MNSSLSGCDQNNETQTKSRWVAPSLGRPLLRFIQLPHHGISLLLITGFVFNAPASQARDGDLTLAASTGVTSRHVYRGVDRSATAWQAGLDGSVAGWRGQFWSSRPLDAAEPGELRSLLGYVWSPAKALTLEVTGTHFWYVDAAVKGAAAHSFEGAMQMVWNRSDGWRPGLSYAYDIRFRSRAVEASLAYDVALKSWGTFLESRAYGGHLAADDALPDTTGAAVRDAYSYFGLDVRLPYRIVAATELALEAHCAGAVGQNRVWSPLNRGAGTRGWITFAARFEF